MLVSVLTPTIPGREHLLEECCLSVGAQTYKPVEHVVVLDEAGAGCAVTMNEAASRARGEWLFPLADDDFLCPGGIRTFMGGATDGVDVVYGSPLVWGEPADQFCGDPPMMGSGALIRASAWRTVGGYNTGLSCREDRDLWERMLQRNMRFVRVTSGPTRVYRFWRQPDGTPGNKSRR